MSKFCQTLDVCGLIDMGYEGCKFTWSNKHSDGSLVRERLDRSVCNLLWQQLFPFAKIRVGASSRSDHKPLILLLAQDSAWGSGRKRKRFFRFEGLWAKYAECRSIVSNCWDATKPKDLQGVATTLQQIGSFLSQWGSQRFGSLRRAIEQKRLVRQ